MSIDPVAKTAGAAAGAALALAPMPADARAARDAKAVANLKAFGAEDLLEMLGLADEELPSGGPRSVACPTCGAIPDASCAKQYQEGTTARYHRARYRLVGAERS